jgi:hypothetical protein
MASWPSVQISAPDDGALITLTQTDATTIACEINEDGAIRSVTLENCTASANRLALVAEDDWLLFSVKVEIYLTPAASSWTATIIANETTVHHISQADFNAAQAFINACGLPPITAPADT